MYDVWPSWPTPMSKIWCTKEVNLQRRSTHESNSILWKRTQNKFCYQLKYDISECISFWFKRKTTPSSIKHDDNPWCSEKQTSHKNVMQRLPHIYKHSDQSGGSAHCRSCVDSNPTTNRNVENLPHILAVCSAYSDIRERIMHEYANLCNTSGFDFNSVLSDSEQITQFVLDPTSLNLKLRISASDPHLATFFKLSRDYCYSVHNRRMEILKQKEDSVKHRWL